jgi:drug/metabolite transporter (DMT)-like permease
MVKKKPREITPLSFLLVIFSIGTLFLLPFFLRDAHLGRPIQWNNTLVFSIAYLSIGTSVICFWIWNIAIGKIGAMRTILFGNLIPIFGTIGSVILLHEQFTWVHVLSMATVFSGIILANLRIFRPG